mmetsp:Transcript_17135/g.19752  ORF Transcript_17135/g.19752 Transcript_17135/m.19752 type:complete len:87 (+) Transcript_17135:385-645(+)
MNYSLFQKVIKMDSFINIGVTAGDWIPIEECEEEVSFPESHLFLKRRVTGYSFLLSVLLSFLLPNDYCHLNLPRSVMKISDYIDLV